MTYNKFSTDFGARVRYYRNIARLSQEKLAEEMGCAVNTIKYIESGKNNLSFSKLPKLCEALGVEPYQLFIFDVAPDIDRLQAINKILNSMTDAQLGVVKDLLLSITALRPDQVPEAIK